MFTEDEAKQKHCPFARTLYANTLTSPMGGAALSAAAYNRSKKHISKCLASECMAWRFGNTLQGYCGLAGTL